MKVINGEIILEQYHFERLDKGLLGLKIKKPVFFAAEKIREAIIHLCRKNKCENHARVRLSVSRGNGGVNDCDDKFQYMVECWPLEESTNKWNENGLIIDIFPDARKSIDKFSNLKTANYLPFVMAAIWAKENKLNDALLLNSKERICEATIANVFWVKDGIVFTPPLTEGCIEGVMRRFLIENQIKSRIQIKEKEFLPIDLENADEVFLTNAIKNIRWVKQYSDKTYGSVISKNIYDKLSR
jgi:branched-chain amino acid aminotransferase